MDLVVKLITRYKCDAKYQDTDGSVPLHYAASRGHLELVKYFIHEHSCDPMFRDNTHWTPLHYACASGYQNIVQYLIEELHCDPSCESKTGETPLHHACLNGHAHIVQYLLSIHEVNPMATNKIGGTPIDYARIHDNSYNLLRLFRLFSQCKEDFPVHTYTKLILTGYSGAGKTTLSQLIHLIANETGILSWLSSGRVPNVECHTAGIIPLHIESKVKKVNNMVLYDFAGQQEYYSSHNAVLECVMKHSAANFICVINLSEGEEKICESVHYWISFIENACSSVSAGSSNIMIVGSHADLLSKTEVKCRSEVVENIAKSRMQKLTYGGFVSMDCRQSKTKQARNFCTLLLTSQKSILSCQPGISLYCHVLYAFLNTKLKETACTLQELASIVAYEKDFFIDHTKSILDHTLLKDLLVTLSDKGLILFFLNEKHFPSSWIVVKKDILLKDVNGTLFSPYNEVASNTGIVPIKTLEKLFPQYNTAMLVGCLESMEFCRPVEIENLESDESSKECLTSLSHEKYLFFPCLVQKHRPSNLPSCTFGWCLGCSDSHQFFSNRFLHVLLLRLAFKFSLASKHLPSSSSIIGFERQCKVWQNGISWKSVSGVSTIVEIVGRNRWIIVLASEKSNEAAKIYSSVIRIILDLQKQLSSVAKTSECLISPNLLTQYPFDALPDTELFDMPTVARSMLFRHKLILDQKEGTNAFSTDEALSCEPYYLMRPSSVDQLFNKSTAGQPVPDSLLQDIVKCCYVPNKPQNHKEMRKFVNHQSIFAGRNPLVSSIT